MATKLARQMALKKKLEEEYRQANEILNDRSKLTPNRKYHPMQFDFDAKSRYSPIEIRGRRSVFVEEEEIRNVADDNEERKRIKREEKMAKKRELDERLLREEEERLKREEEERKKRELEERLNVEKEERRKKEELRRKKIVERQRRLEAKRRREEKRAFDKKEMEEIRMFKIDEGSRSDKSDEEIKRLKELEEAQNEEMIKTEQRIKMLEMSIANLNLELERYDLEDMKDKTRKVVKRMSLVLKDVEDEEVDVVLQVTTVTGFMENEDLWSKYISQGTSIAQ